MKNNNYEILRDAIARNSTTVMSLPSAGMVRHHKSRFLVEEDKGFWLETPDTDRPLIDALIAEKTPVGIAFKAGTTSIICATTILRLEEAFQLNANSTVAALFMSFPQDFQRKQRRQAYRVALPIHCPVILRVWRIAEHFVLRDRPWASLEIGAKLEDLSVSGMAIQCRPGRDGQATTLTTLLLGLG